jgi:hypothetical protein
VENDCYKIRTRLNVLLHEAKNGVTEAKLHAQAVVYAYAREYDLPGAIEFYNALNFCQDATKLDWGWINAMDSDMVAHEYLFVDMPCLECCHRMLAAACYQHDPDPNRKLAYFAAAVDSAPDPNTAHDIKQAMKAFAWDDATWLDKAEAVLFKLDDEVMKPVVEETVPEEETTEGSSR